MLLDITARHLRDPTQDYTPANHMLQTCRGWGRAEGSILSSRGASASEDCNRATCLPLQRERQTETETHTHRGREHFTLQQSFLLVKAQFLAEHLRLWDWFLPQTSSSLFIWRALVALP